MSHNYISRHMHDEADSGVISAVGDYSSTEKKFIITPPEGEVYFLHRMIVHIRDAGNLDTNSYGNMITLADGIQLKIENSSEVEQLDLLNGITIKNNGDWQMFSHDAQLSTFGTGDQILSIRWTFSRAGAALKLANGDRLVAILNDDFSDLVAHHFMIQGHTDEI